ncbi:MAG: phosphoribosylglycinamide formyltransferase [Actinobacteria bacterium RBG_13_35_12]|uniref:Phosphoribosylglycinamide formyltransferase n=1 Tax=Candidatus Sediminicultor quintus TaxID=1797291 RepID=A0A1F5AAN8_9BACT|nr:MAG: phosphoribosylglycinamide formyltransferase [Actinobacteria bacterium RBG_13_35_12]OGD14914.1 MAG: phosphoribosylglycinamide formyltransferase [Candidatus Atribacteria bacterium RBG_19FT_COMBO_35_14]
MINIGVLASGRGTNLQAIIEAIEEGKIAGEIKVVISDNPDAYALKRAQQHHIATRYIHFKEFKNREDYDKEIIKTLKEKKIELVVLAGYMRILSPYFIRTYKNKIMNIHPALLPSFPGLHAQEQAVEYGVKVSGCTVHFVDKGVDSGPIILQKAVEVSDDDTEESLAEKILKEEHQIYPRAIQLFSQGRLIIKGRRVFIK